MKQAQPSQLFVEQIPVDQIQPSPTNPRKHYDPSALEELAASIKSVGVQVPLSLRVRGFAGPNGEPTEKTIFEIVGGERRWRAAQIAGLSSVPAIARVMTDAECRESQLVDNLQRADLTPIEEAECYAQLFDRPEILPIEVLAAKVGKTVPYVAQRLRLLQLVAPAREALRLGVLTAESGRAMKALVFLIVATLVILTAHVAFNLGQQKQRQVEALCGEPGVRCIVRFSYDYFKTHRRSIFVPAYATAELGDDDGGLR
jgi:ParB family chromosome partitioning protein